SLPIQTQSLYFTGPRAVEVRSAELAGPGPREVLLTLQVSGFRAGTELDAFRALARQWRQWLGRKPRLFSDAHGSDWQWPARYGYAAVGKVSELGAGVEGLKSGDRVFAYVPHGQHAVVPANSVIPLGDLADAEIGVFFANLNTAYNGVL